MIQYTEQVSLCLYPPICFAMPDSIHKTTKIIRLDIESVIHIVHPKDWTAVESDAILIFILFAHGQRDWNRFEYQASNFEATGIKPNQNSL